MAPKTTIEKIETNRELTAAFKITGTLGFHEKANLEKLFAECRKRSIERIVFDMSNLRSLGGGCAQILRNEAVGGMHIAIAAAPTVALRFLKGEDTENIAVVGSMDDAFDGAEGAAAPPTPSAAVPGVHPAGADSPAGVDAAIDVILGDDSGEAPAAEAAKAGTANGRTAKAEAAKAGTTNGSTAKAEARKAGVPTGEEGKAAIPATAKASGTARDASATTAGRAPTKELQKRIVQYNTILSINTEFHRFSDCRSLIDSFLLTLIAQVGVESAVFMEHNNGYYVPVSEKGIEAAEVRGLALSSEQLCVSAWVELGNACAIDECPFGDDVKAPLLSLGCSTVAPFIVQGEVRGFVLLGQPIKNELDDSTLEFLHMVISQGALAYGSMVRFEQENERTLGLVQTLISLIEENTLARGNTNLISNYVYALAGALHYPEEHIRDLMYGTVLRDIGMIKVSDLIVRSPRELMPEEWEIIKRHPIDGSQMLERMRFAKHAVDIVRSHHERFNGEGYPDGLQGQDVPLGARVVSVVESFAAMLQERPTRPALTREEALHTLKENWGMRYDPEIIARFVNIVEAEIRSGEAANEQRFELFNV